MTTTVLATSSQPSFCRGVEGAEDSNVVYIFFEWYRIELQVTDNKAARDLLDKIKAVTKIQIDTLNLGTTRKVGG